jgi:branched-subunit amino acid aminotransferase/4-amino-4-deoxychorismate lyase
MRTVIELLATKGYKIRYEPISRSMIYTCDELFLTGTAAGVIFADSVIARFACTLAAREACNYFRHAGYK